MNIKVGDVCKVDIVRAQREVGGFGGHQLKILKDIVRQGGGFVDVEKIIGDRAMVSAHDNPMSKMVGVVQVPISALKVVNVASDRESRIAKKVIGMTLAKERLENAKRMIEGGGRGIELGIREIDYLAHDMAELHKQMRRIQSDFGISPESITRELLEVLGRYM